MNADVVVEYAVVGAGSAGCVLADRLSADGDSRVALIEAGGPDRRAEVSIPAAFPKLFGTPLDWAFRTVPQPELAGRRVAWPRGRTLGGSSSLNAQIWTRGHRADYDGWAAGDCPGWSFAEVLPYFRRAEDRAGGAGRAGYGVGGPIRIEDLREVGEATVAFLLACAQAGHVPMGATEATAPEGFAPVRVTQRRGRRWSAADGYLRPALDRPNLTVLTTSQARRVVLDAGRAVGVEVQTGDGMRLVRVTREVVLAAGAVGSPQLLMLSGVGAPDRLREHGLPVRVPLPAVGENLSDHLYVPLSLSAASAVSPGVGDQRGDALEYLRGRRGRLTSNLAEALLFLRTEQRLPAPDIELVWMPVPSLAGGAAGHGLTLAVVLLQPASRGRVTLGTADPAAAPLIDPGYLSDPAGADLRTLVAGVRRAQDILGQEALSPWLGEPLQPAALDRSPAAVAAFTRQHAETLYHPVGTCRMGTDDGSVVDLEFRVRGTSGLRVVDASTMPVIPRGHTHAPTVMLAERAAELIAKPLWTVLPERQIAR